MNHAIKIIFFYIYNSSIRLYRRFLKAYLNSSNQRSPSMGLFKCVNKICFFRWIARWRDGANSVNISGVQERPVKEAGGKLLLVPSVPCRMPPEFVFIVGNSVRVNLPFFISDL